MLKQIPKSDINLRPFKVYKNFNATNYDSGSGFVAYEVRNNYTASLDLLSDDELRKKATWHQLYAMYYRDPHNPFTTYGDISPQYTENTESQQRYLGNNAIVFEVPQSKFGEQIKPNSVKLTLDGSSETLKDDGYGNLYSDYSEFLLAEVNVNTGIITYIDVFGVTNQLEFKSINLNTNQLILADDTELLLIGLNIEQNTLSALGNVANSYVGNIFYSHGILVVTRGVGESEIRNNITSSAWNLNYNSTETIYENEIFINVDAGEFNVSTNPTAINELNIVTGSIILNNGTHYLINAGNDAGGFVNYFDSLNNERVLAIEPNNVYNFYASSLNDYELISCSLEKIKENKIKYRNSDKYQKPEFNNYEYSASVDPTGSFLTPYITTIGLYDENYDMVAVAKLPQAIKSYPDLPVNFLIRIDT